MTLDVDKLTRVTVVTDNGRELEVWGQEVSIYVQEDGRTLKVFTKSRENK